MRIALIVNNYPPMVGGIEYHEENLAHSLADLGHDVWVINLAGPTATRRDGSVTVITHQGHFNISDIIRTPGLGTTRKLARFLKAHAIEVVSTHTRFFPMSFVGLRAAKRAGIPVIHTEHGSGFVATKNPIIWLGSRTVDLTLGRYTLRHADKVLGVSEQVTTFVKKLSGVDASVFYNAITPPQLRPHTPDRSTHLVFVGRMVAGKGWDTFIDAVARLRTEGYDIDAEILGDGPQLADAQRIVAERGLEQVISVPGRVAPQEVRKRLRGATLVNPTVLSEGFQTTLVEVLAEGGQVVTFPVAGAAMLAERGAPVEICSEKSAEALIAGLRNILAHTRPRASQELITEFTWPRQARVYAHICGSLL
ncbi:glycosyltransferase family 4 protein [Arcanobacterium haemolyticum]|uniref:Glycosyl transferase group 1 n=1 Tax=Arcanobacterium haemolyticum (strain ATCC 9345 / DSM 20595 / CCM 5947 / CCUG 17215 / LMG 16163 / NBRC 15585 / NCTC 8452 / 11018) TaxID=644284 RepID=D7BLQ0_ARCHD|nr:glycosyltransferase family 4 protein [Arcanobacterium haemolyticum]ADH91849.1 glycosyl transferase group 1 [Arcanobacterium haemolyticum DSM 20595]SQH27216.1 colanic acid biosynthesis glycosyltransferase WcaL [Arcanobacterium haemolyticum]